MQIRKLSGGASVTALLLVAGLSLSGCATKTWVREQIAIVDTRVTAVEAMARDGIQRADAANAAAQAASASAQSANAAAMAAANDARAGSQRLDQLNTRVDTMEQQSVRRSPRN